jgi:hypothetical protein
MIDPMTISLSAKGSSDHQRRVFKPHRPTMKDTSFHLMPRAREALEYHGLSFSSTLHEIVQKQLEESVDHYSINSVDGKIVYSKPDSVIGLSKLRTEHIYGEAEHHEYGKPWINMGKGSVYDRIPRHFGLQETAYSMFILEYQIYSPRVQSFLGLLGAAMLTNGLHTNYEEVIIKWEERKKKAKRLFYVATMAAKLLAEAPEAEHLQFIKRITEYILGAKADDTAAKTDWCTRVFRDSKIVYTDNMSCQCGCLGEGSVLKRCRIIKKTVEDDVGEYSKRNPLQLGGFLMRFTVRLRLARKNALILSHTRALKLSTFSVTFRKRCATPSATGDSEGTFSEKMGFATFVANVYVGMLLKRSVHLSLCGISLFDRRGKVSSDDTMLRLVFGIVHPELYIERLGTILNFDRILRTMLSAFRLPSLQEVQTPKIVIGTSTEKIGPTILDCTLPHGASRSPMSVYLSLETEETLGVLQNRIKGICSHVRAVQDNTKRTDANVRYLRELCLREVIYNFPGVPLDAAELYMKLPEEHNGAGMYVPIWLEGFAQDSAKEEVHKAFVNDIHEGTLWKGQYKKSRLAGALLTALLNQGIKTWDTYSTRSFPFSSRIPSPDKPTAELDKNVTLAGTTAEMKVYDYLKEDRSQIEEKEIVDNARNELIENGYPLAMIEEIRMCRAKAADDHNCTVALSSIPHRAMLIKSEKVQNAVARCAFSNASAMQMCRVICHLVNQFSASSLVRKRSELMSTSDFAEKYKYKPARLGFGHNRAMC